MLGTSTDPAGPTGPTDPRSRPPAVCHDIAVRRGRAVRRGEGLCAETLLSAEGGAVRHDIAVRRGSSSN